jgi:hypothetical protein
VNQKLQSNTAKPRCEEKEEEEDESEQKGGVDKERSAYQAPFGTNNNSWFQSFCLLFFDSNNLIHGNHLHRLDAENVGKETNKALRNVDLAMNEEGVTSLYIRSRHICWKRTWKKSKKKDE